MLETTAQTSFPPPPTSPLVKLREDLIFTPLLDRHGSWTYQIEDPSRSKFFRIGLAEYTFISLLDGKMNLDDALRVARNSKHAAELSSSEATSIVKWLFQTELTSSIRTRASDAGSLPRRNGVIHTNRLLNVLFMRIPILSPDRLIQKWIDWLAWMHRPITIFFWSLLLLTAGYLVSCQWTRFTAASTGVLAPDNWMWLFAAWFVLKGFHELGHAVVCRMYGGRVGKLGLMLILFAPLTYVDVSSSWRFTSRWHRIHVALAGIFMDLSIAAIAAIFWSFTTSELIGHRLYCIIVIGTVSTLLFNANPLMKSDGYFVLTDLCGIPNLHMLARDQIILKLKRILGEPSVSCSAFNARTSILLIAFGLAVWAWRLFIYLCLIIGTMTLFYGAGIVIACFIGLSLALPALFSLWKMMNSQVIASHDNPLRRSLLGISLILLFVAFGWEFTWTRHCTAPGIVRFSPHQAVRTQSPGFLTELKIPPDGVVLKGDLLAVFSNDELAVEFESLRISVEAARLKCQLLNRTRQEAERRIELENLAGLETQLAEKQKEFDGLRIVAPVDGYIVDRALPSKLGTYFEAGTHLMTIGAQHSPEMRASVAQEDVRSLADKKGKSIDIRISGIGRLKGTLKRIIPRGSDRLNLPELSAANGGPLPIMLPTENEDNPSDQSYRLTDPRFDAVFALTSPNQELLSGQFGVASWNGDRLSIFQRLSNRFRHWMRSRETKT